MSPGRAYETSAAFRRSLTDKLRAVAKESRWNLQQLQRQIAYDRLLERLYVVNDGWILKGATALLARQIGVRGTLDIDIYRPVDAFLAESDLRRAAASDIGDWFRFEVGPARPMDGGANGVRFQVNAYIGPTIWVRFRVDIMGTELRMTGQPEDVPPLARVLMPAVEQHGYRAYPLVDHVADKVLATFQRYGSLEAPSTRYKDLVDLVAIVTSVSVEAAPQIAAVQAEAGRRQVKLPNAFDVPDRALWERGYRAEARRSLLDLAPTLDDALAFVQPFVDPLLDATARGRWRPKEGLWQE